MLYICMRRLKKPKHTAPTNPVSWSRDIGIEMVPFNNHMMPTGLSGISPAHFMPAAPPYSHPSYNAGVPRITAIEDDPEPTTGKTVEKRRTT